MKRPLPSIQTPIVLILVLSLLGGPVGSLNAVSGTAAPAPGGAAQDSSELQGETSKGPFGTNSEFANTLRLAGPLQLPSLDPAIAKDLGSMFLVRQVFAGLMRFDDDLNPIPAVAESVEISEDGLTYRFLISKQARFFSGDAITAGDAAFSLTRALDPDTTGGDTAALAAPTFLADILGAEEFLAGDADELVGVSALDERTLEIQLTRPRSTFLMRLASAPASIVDEGDLSLGDRWWEAPNASGPFSIREFVDGSLMTLEANEHYVLGPPRLDSVEIRLGTEAFGSLNLYENSLVDVTGVDYLNIERVADPASPLQPDLRVTPLFSVEYIAFRSDIEPLNDPAIRQALLLGYPRHRVAEVTFNGRGAVAEGLIPDGMLGVERWDVDAGYDLERARELIAGSSYGSPEKVPPISLYTAVPQRAESFRDAIQRDLGLQVDVIVVDWVSYLTGLANQEYPAYLLYWGADYPDPESMIEMLFGSSSPDNYTGYRNDELDALLDDARTSDRTERIALFELANQLLIDDAALIPLYHPTGFTLLREGLGGVDVTPMGIVGLETIQGLA